jgi:hypothetical protein
MFVTKWWTFSGFGFRTHSSVVKEHECTGLSYDIVWTPRIGERQQEHGCGFESVNELEHSWDLTVSRYKVKGWTPTRWWQWWRRDDTRLTS